MAESVTALSRVNGQRFGRLTALGFAGVEQGVFLANVRNWTFRCDCGETVTGPLFKARRGVLTSCGCQDRDERAKLFAVPGNARMTMRPVIHRYEVTAKAYDQVMVAKDAKSVIALWIDEGDYSAGQIAIIEEAKLLWTLIARPTHDLFGSDDPEDRREGLLAERAKALLRNCRRLVGLRRWQIFENVIRWNEPLGFIGSRVMDGSQGGHYARETVAEVSLEIAEAGILDETGFSRQVGE